MEILRIGGMTRDIGRPANWNEELDGPCGSLPVRDEIDTQSGYNFMYSLWKPSREEIEILLQGGAIKLGVGGVVHPVVNMQVVL